MRGQSEQRKEIVDLQNKAIMAGVELGRGESEARIKELEAANAKLLEACKMMVRISGLWLPDTASMEHLGEAQALHSAIKIWGGNQRV